MENAAANTQVVALLSKIDRSECMEEHGGKFFLQKRYLVAFLAFLAWIFLFLMRANLSISIVDMTSNRSVIVGNETITQVAEFEWSSKEKGVILSAFSWGFTTAPLGAFVARKCGGVTAFGLGIALTGLLTVLTPLLMRYHLYIYLAARILEGVAEGISVSSGCEVLRVWTTPKDRCRLAGLVSSGYLVGAMLGFPICGTIAHYKDWKGVFYITGGASLMLSLIWLALIRNSPENDNMITVQEKRYFKQFNSSRIGEKVAVPWKQILASKAVWAYLNERFAAAWSESFVSYSLPLYIKDIHDVNIQDIGFITSIPHFCAAVSLVLASFLADFLRNRGILSPSNVHKANFGCGQFTALVLFVIVALSENFVTSIVCFCLLRMFATMSFMSYHVLPVDIAGQYSSFILGLGQTFTAIGFTLSPMVMGWTVTHHTSAEWSTYFLILSCLNIWGGIMFLIFGTGELQPWAIPSSNCEDTEH